MGLTTTRPNQRTPQGEWFAWLILAGRGWGKTRTGAEDMARYANLNPGARVAVVAATWSSARDVCVEGESGLLGIIPQPLVEAWNRSLGELILKNGSRFKLFSADEPDRLRGYQHHRAWCLTGDTRVLMADGSTVLLSHVRAGDLVATSRGPRHVVESALTRSNAEVFRLRTVGGRVIIGTADHPIWVEGQGFIALELLRKGMTLCVANVLSGAGKPGTGIRANITAGMCGCMWQSGNRQTVQCQRVSTSITSTAIRQTTGWGISNCSLTESTAAGTLRKRLDRTENEHLKCQDSPYLKRRLIDESEFCGASSAMEPITAGPRIQLGFAPLLALRLRDQVRSRANSGSANSAARNIRLDGVCRSTVADSVMQDRQLQGIRSEIGWSSALNAAPVLEVLGPTRGSAHDRVLWLFTDTIDSVERLSKPSDVYDITVDGAAEFFANGILTHNCDELASWRYPDAWDQLLLGLRLGNDPRVVVTTTPRPVAIVRSLLSRSGVVVTRGSTFENAANLAPAAIAQLRDRYEGTRLGRQELYAEVLDDVPGALWQRDQIDRLRVRQAPEMQRVIVSIDPAGTSGEDADETGIIVAGLGVDGHGYLLADRSCRLSPDGWAKRAAIAYDEFEGDRIIAERNFGADLVERVFRTVGRNYPFRTVVASRGKAVRADPVSALYEQGRVHHVGGFPELEDQLCQFTPEGCTADNDDRADALVWAFTELMLERRGWGAV